MHNTLVAKENRLLWDANERMTLNQEAERNQLFNTKPKLKENGR
jgi:hypothetical protein